ncbi:hypothetical protein D3C80_2098400 [compost metagenome]
MLHRREHLAQREISAAGSRQLLKQIQVELENYPFALRRSKKIMHVSPVDKLHFPLLHADWSIIYSQI